MVEGEGGSMGGGSVGPVIGPETAAPGHEGSDKDYISKETFDRMEERVWSDRQVVKKSKAMEAAKQIGLEPKLIEGLRAERNEYMKRRSEATLQAFDLADEYIADAFKLNTKTVELPGTGRYDNNKPLNADIWEAVRGRIYEPMVTAVEEGSKEVQDSAGTPKIPGLTARIDSDKKDSSKQILTISWLPEEPR